MMRMVYMDYAATTPLDEQVLLAMLPYFNEKFGNASSVHSYGREARKAVEQARDKVATVLGCTSGEILFAGGGTEADNLAIIGATANGQRRGKHIITSPLEHHAVSENFEMLQERGYEVTYLPVDEYGYIEPGAVRDAITPETALVSIIHGNNEIGTIQDAAAIGAICKEKGVTFHLDAVQTVGHLPIDVSELNCDLLSLAAHKFYGPKGSGALYVRRGVRLTPQVRGGAQERGLRAGTENVPGIVGLGEAIYLAEKYREERCLRETALRDELIAGLLQIPHVRLNGHPQKRLANNVNVSIFWIEGESILLALDLKGIAASSGSACTSGSLEPSHVLLGIGLDHETAHGSLRLTLGKDNTEEDVAYLLATLPPIVQRLRELSPIWPGNRR